MGRRRKNERILVEAYDSRQAVSLDISGVAQEVVNIFEHAFTNHEKITGSVPAKTYTLTHGIVDGISVVVLTHGLSGIGLRLNLQEDGDWEVEAFSYDDVRGEEVVSPGCITALAGTTLVEEVKRDLKRISKEHAWEFIDEQRL